MEQKKNHEIDIVGIIKKILKEWKLLTYFVISFAVFGVIIALNTQKTYTSTVILAPELSGGTLPEGLSSLASMVGVNIGGSSQNGVDAIYPQIYPDVLTSSDFILKLFNVKVQQYEDTTTKTYYRHLLEDAFIPFWKYPKLLVSKIFKKDESKLDGHVNAFMLTKRQNEVLNEIRANVSCVVDKNTSVISISVSDFDKKVAAVMADTIQKQLRNYITIYRTQKARNDMEYTEKLYKESKAEYIRAQQKYSSYADANEDLMLVSFKAKQDELENEMQLRYNIYNQIAQQLQITKAKVQEVTPVFSVIQGASVPVKASSMPRSVMVLLYMFLGVIVDAVWILYIRDIVNKRKLKKG